MQVKIGDFQATSGDTEISFLAELGKKKVVRSYKVGPAYFVHYGTGNWLRASRTTFFLGSMRRRVPIRVAVPM